VNILYTAESFTITALKIVLLSESAN